MRRKWYLPLTVLGLGGLGMLVASQTGERAWRWLRSSWGGDEEQAWEEAAERELARLQSAIDQVKEKLQAAE